jgi:hypothetical protein
MPPRWQPANDGAGRACSGVPPSADRGRWDDILRAIFAGYTLVNWTDVNYGKCHTYEVMMPRGSTAAPGSLEEEQQLVRALGGSRASLLLKLSVIAPYYLLCVVVRDLEAHAESVRERYVQPRSAEEQDLWTRAVEFAEQHGFSAIDLESLSAPISEIEIELAEPGAVIAYNCLFEDQANLVPLPFAAPAAADSSDDASHPDRVDR